MSIRSTAPTVLATLIIALFCVGSVYNQLRIVDVAMALAPAPARATEQTRLASGWMAAVTILSHLGLCSILAMLMTGIARLQGIALRSRSVVIAVGFAHVPLLIWTSYGVVLFTGSFEKEQLEVFAGSIGRLMVARAFAYVGAIIWLVPLSVWQFSIGMWQAATLSVAPVLAIWAILSILGSVINVIPR